jgi:hypothetical protein
MYICISEYPILRLGLSMLDQLSKKKSQKKERKKEKKRKGSKEERKVT